MITRIVTLALFVGAGLHAEIVQLGELAKEQHASIASTVLSAADEKTTTSYKTRQGDTLASIAKRFAMKEEQLEKTNPDVDFRKLRVGQPIKVASVKEPKS